MISLRINIIIFVHPAGSTGLWVFPPQMIMSTDWGVSPMNDGTSIIVFYNPDMGISTASILHMLETAFFVAIANPPSFYALIGHPQPIFRNPCGRIAATSPKNHSSP